MRRGAVLRCIGCSREIPFEISLPRMYCRECVEIINNAPQIKCPNCNTILDVRVRDGDLVYFCYECGKDIYRLVKVEEE